MAARLHCFMNGEFVGDWQIDPARFQYHPDWLKAPHARPLSLSMPLRRRAYCGAPVAAFFDNLLPELPQIRSRLASSLGLKGSNPGDILSELGRDCAGALQLMPPELAPPEPRLTGIPLRSETLEKFLRVVPRTPIMRCLRHHYRVALAGIQDKTALLYLKDEWRMPTHSTPTTHIIKVAPSPLVLQNEWLCLQILQEFGLPVAQAELQRVGTQTVLTLERFDRRWSPDGLKLLRLPTEDLCQALGIASHRRYQRDGGPGIKQAMDLLLGSSRATQDRYSFFSAQVLFWMLGATDGHGKNFSLFLEPQGRFRLAPLYDVVSSYPTPTQLAMQVAEKTEWSQVTPEDWQIQAQRCKFHTHAKALIQHLKEQTPRVIETVLARLPQNFPAQLADHILFGLGRTALKL